MTKDFKSKNRSLKGTETHTICYQCHTPRKLYSPNREKMKLQSYTSLLLTTKSIYLTKFSLHSNRPDHAQNSFLRLIFHQLSVCLLFCPLFFPHLERTNFGTKLFSFPLKKHNSIFRTFFCSQHSSYFPSKQLWTTLVFCLAWQTNIIISKNMCFLIKISQCGTKHIYE